MKKIIIAFFCFVCAIAGAETIADQLTTLNTIKSDIKAAIASKGQIIGNDFRTYDDAIASITTGGGIDLPTSVTNIASAAAGESILANIPAVIIGNGPWLPVASAPSAYPPASHLWSSAVRISAGGAYMAVVHPSSPYMTTYKYNTELLSWSSLANPDELPAAAGCCAGISSDGARLVIATLHNEIKCYLWNGTKYQVATAPDDPISGGSLAVAMAADGSTIVTDTYITSPFIKTYKWDTADGRFEKTANVKESMANYVDALALSDNASKMVAGCRASPYLRAYRWVQSANRYETATGTSTGVDVGPAGRVYAVTMSDDGDYMVAGTFTSPYIHAYVWSDSANKYQQINNVYPALNNGIKGVQLSGDGKFLIISGDYTTPNNYVSLYVYDKTYNRYYKSITPSSLPSAAAGGVAMSADAAKMAVVGGSNYLITYNMGLSFQDWAIYGLASSSYLPYSTRYLGYPTSNASVGGSSPFVALWAFEKFSNYEE